jgi:hypothetical protein
MVARAAAEAASEPNRTEQRCMGGLVATDGRTDGRILNFEQATVSVHSAAAAGAGQAEGPAKVASGSRVARKTVTFCFVC